MPALRSWQESLDAPAWDGEEVWVHGDLLPGTLLVVGGRLSAVIDFGGFNVGDPACDLQPAWNVFAGGSRLRFRAELDADDASWLRGRGWTLYQAVMALPYYWDTNRGMIRQASRAGADPRRQPAGWLSGTFFRRLRFGILAELSMLDLRTYCSQQSGCRCEAVGGMLSDAAMLSGMTEPDPKADLHRYLQAGREALLWKLEGLSEYDVRRPLVPTGTNLLGLVKHAARVEAGYFGETFGRPFTEPPPWMDESAEPNADMWATVDESREHIINLYHRVWVHADATIDALALDATGHVPWWPPERREVTLHRILVHVVAETHRHAGHADIVRELVDGTVGLREGNDNMPHVDGGWWASYRSRLERVAQEASSA